MGRDAVAASVRRDRDILFAALPIGSTAAAQPIEPLQSARPGRSAGARRCRGGAGPGNEDRERAGVEDSREGQREPRTPAPTTR